MFNFIKKTLAFIGAFLLESIGDAIFGLWLLFFVAALLFGDVFHIGVMVGLFIGGIAIRRLFGSGKA